MLVVKNPPANAIRFRTQSLIPGSGRSPRGGNGNPLQYSFLENPADSGAWRASVHRVAQSLTQLKWLSTAWHQITPKLNLKNTCRLSNNKIAAHSLWVSLYSSLAGWCWLWASPEWAVKLGVLLHHLKHWPGQEGPLPSKAMASSWILQGLSSPSGIFSTRICSSLITGLWGYQWETERETGREQANKGETENPRKVLWSFFFYHSCQILCIRIEPVIPTYFLGEGITYGYEELGFPGSSAGKESACNAGNHESDLRSIPGLERSPGEGNSYTVQYSGLENSMDRGAWQATVHGVTKSQTQLSNLHFHFHD